MSEGPLEHIYVVYLGIIHIAHLPASGHPGLTKH